MSQIPTCAHCGQPAFYVRESVEREGGVYIYDWVTRVCPAGHETKRRENILKKKPGMMDEDAKW